MWGGILPIGQEIACHFSQDHTLVTKNSWDQTQVFNWVGGFQKSYVIFGGGMPKYLLFLTGVGEWSGKGQKHPT